MICPHNKNVSSAEVYGIKVYKHDDGSNCDCMNKTKIDISELLCEYNKNYKNFDSDFIFEFSQNERKKKYKEFAMSKTKDDAVRYLMLFSEYYSYNEEITQELNYVFGEKKIKCALGNFCNIVLVNITKTKKYKVDNLTKYSLPDCLDERKIKNGELYEKLKERVDRVNKMKYNKGWYKF